MQVKSLNAIVEPMQELKSFSFIKANSTIAKLTEELATFISAAAGVTVTCGNDKYRHGGQLS